MIKICKNTKEKFLNKFKEFNNKNNNEYKLLAYSTFRIYYSHLVCGHINNRTIRAFWYDRPLCNNKECKVKRHKNVILKKYGVENPSQIKEVKEKKREKLKINRKNGVEQKRIEKIKQTKKEKYGKESYNNRKKYKRTCKRKYGVENGFQSKEIISKIKKIRRKNYYNKKILNFNYITPLFSENEYVDIEHSYKWKCNKCGNIFKDHLDNGYIPICKKCSKPKRIKSKPEYELQNWLFFYLYFFKNKKFYFKDKSYQELDIYIPEKNIGIELNGIYWHCEKSLGRDKKYHLDKTNFFKNKGIQVIHILDSEWNFKQDIVKSLILNKLNLITNKIYARKCEIREITNKEGLDFFNKTHLQGGINSKINIGLFYKNELISAMSFSKSRYNKKHIWELTRFSSKLYTCIVGGFSKLLKYFEKNYSGSIISYADKRISKGSVYLKNNFKLIGESSPNYYYTKDYINIYSRLQFQKHKLKEKLGVFNEELTEWENMQINGYDRIWDCGNYVFEKIKEE